MKEWRSHEDMPKDGRWFFVVGPDFYPPAHCRYDTNEARFVIHLAGGVHHEGNGEYVISNWMELPEPPSDAN